MKRTTAGEHSERCAGEIRGTFSCRSARCSRHECRCQHRLSGRSGLCLRCRCCVDRFHSRDFRDGALQRLLNTGSQRHRAHGAGSARAQQFELDNVIGRNVQEPYRSAVRHQIRADGVKRFFDLVSQLRVGVRVGGGRGCRVGHENKAGRKNKKGREVKRGEAVSVKKCRPRRVSPGPCDEEKAYRGKRSI